MLRTILLIKKPGFEEFDILKEKKIKEITHVFKRGLTSYKLKKADSGTNEIRVIGMKAVQKGHIDAENAETIHIKDGEISNKDKIKSGDLILSIRGTSFKAAVADESLNGYLLSNNLIALTLSNELKPEVVAAYLNNPIGQRELYKRAGGTTMLTLNKKRLEDITVPMISTEEQEKLARFIQISRDYRQILKKEKELWDKMIETYVAKKMEI